LTLLARACYYFDEPPLRPWPEAPKVRARRYLQPDTHFPLELLLEEQNEKI
jgi:hypothetical protein